MKYEASSPEAYIDQLPEARQVVIKKLRTIIQKNLPKGFEECINYNMIGYVVTHSIYPDGYHCDPKTPLPFMNVASQKKLCSNLSFRDVCKKRNIRLVCRRISKTRQKKIRYGKKLCTF